MRRGGSGSQAGSGTDSKLGPTRRAIRVRSRGRRLKEATVAAYLTVLTTTDTAEKARALAAGARPC
ncbi:hypothetical protein [Streptomyces ziwulingensis]|uniref:Uncharacterized protein n=1 Tax=Streptomyces ziwulingensis TaxID=1045501 RepID=A0ABP9CBN9_9ACTN